MRNADLKKRRIEDSSAFINPQSEIRNPKS